MSPDHVHILVSAPPNLAPNEIMRRINGRTSSYLFQEFPHLKKQYWGRHLWARGYFAVTSGTITDEMINEYINEQEGETVEDDSRFQIDPLEPLALQARVVQYEGIRARRCDGAGCFSGSEERSRYRIG